ncbi:hypothetical protein [Streptomyces sanglieri]|uniref:hypothetical protein n=1 Tax=Streptomyces sanglieri TaxID=193460 RepID=UPI0035248882
MLWVGSVNTPGATGDVYACGPCLVELDAIVRAQAHGRDGADGRAMQAAALAVPTHAPSDGPGTPACEHRRTVNRHGKTFCQACERQLYL